MGYIGDDQGFCNRQLGNLLSGRMLLTLWLYLKIFWVANGSRNTQWRQFLWSIGWKISYGSPHFSTLFLHIWDGQNLLKSCMQCPTIFCSLCGKSVWVGPIRCFALEKVLLQLLYDLKKHHIRWSKTLKWNKKSGLC